MNTEQTAADVDYDPFDEANAASGGGLWDGKTVTITQIKCETRALTFKDGSPVKDAKSGKQAFQNALFIKGIAEGEEKEREEAFGAGDKLVPSADGDSFVSSEPGPIQFHKNSGIYKLGAALKASGFDAKTIIIPGSGGIQRWSVLVGAQFVFKAEAKLGRDGKALKDKKGYDKQSFYPVKFAGRVGGASTKTAPRAAAPQASPLADKATGAILAILADGPVTKRELVGKLAKHLNGDVDSNAIVGLVVRDDFHQGRPWTYAGGSLSL